jgi:hypothetical protein
MNELPIIIYKRQSIIYKCKIKIDCDSQNNRRISLRDAHDDFLVVTASINSAGSRLPPNIVLIKSEFIQQLAAAGIIEDTGEQCPDGRVCRLLVH